LKMIYTKMFNYYYNTTIPITLRFYKMLSYGFKLQESCEIVMFNDKFWFPWLSSPTKLVFVDVNGDNYETRIKKKYVSDSAFDLSFRFV